MNNYTEKPLEVRQAEMKQRMTYLKCLASLARLGTADELYQRVFRPGSHGTRKSHLKRTVENLAAATGIPTDELYLRLFLADRSKETRTDEQQSTAPEPLAAAAAV